MFIVEWFIKWFTVGEKTVGVKQNLSGESLSSPGFTLWAVAQIRKMKTIICSGHAAHCSVPILKYCGITSHYMILVLEGCCSHQLLWCQLYLRAHANGRRRGETVKLNRDLWILAHQKRSRVAYIPPPPLLPERGQQKEVSLCCYFWR